MLSIKQIKNDPRVYSVERNPDWNPEDAKSWPDWHTPKYSLFLNDGWVFSDESHYNGADSVRELNELLKDIMEE